MTDEDDLTIAPRVDRRLPVAVLAVAVCALAFWLWPRAVEVGECGDAAQVKAVDLPASGYCHLTGVVADGPVVAMGKERKDTAHPHEKLRGVRYFVQLRGGDVFAILPAHEPEVADYYTRHDTLSGFEVSGVGRVFDPDPTPGYRGLALALRKKFDVPATAVVRLFDTEDQPDASP